MSDKVEISDIVLDIPDNKSRGYLRRQMVTARYQSAMFDVQRRVEEARGEVDRLEKLGDDASDKQLSSAYAKFSETMLAFEKTLNDTADYIIGYVVAPEDKAAAREVILDLSEDEYRAVLERIQKGDSTEEEGGENPTE